VARWCVRQMDCQEILWWPKWFFALFTARYQPHFVAEFVWLVRFTLRYALRIQYLLLTVWCPAVCDAAVFFLRARWKL
jgi:hypothetical protein